MTAHSLRHVRLFALGLAVALAGLATVIGSGTAKAAPPGAATNLQVYNQQCIAGGDVLVSISWSPSRLGTQWFDVSRSSTFNGFMNQGPLASNAYYIGWTLDDNTTYYGRVATFAPQGILNSDTLQFHTINCGGGGGGGNFTAPHSVDVDVFDDFVRVDWQAGNNNLFYCVDTAFTHSDLVNTRGSWRNWGCGTTVSQLDLDNLACDREHWLRVWAAGPGTSGYSEVVNFVSQDCDINFTAPTNPRELSVSDTSARLAWDRGTNNAFFCVDLARSESDLRNIEGSWFNTACGTTGTVVDVTGLQCGTNYWWRTWAAGPGTSGYTSIAMFTTDDCAAQFVPPTAVDEDATDNPGDEVAFFWDEGSDAFLFCVDYAGSEDDLEDLTGSWRNQCVSGNVESTIVDNPNYWDCGETFFWRVFGAGNTGNGYSNTRSFTIPDC